MNKLRFEFHQSHVHLFSNSTVDIKPPLRKSRVKTRHDMMTESIDPVFDGKWDAKSLARAYAFYQIKDEYSQCGCGRNTKRVFDGKCYTCHRHIFIACGRNPCPPLP